MDVERIRAIQSGYLDILAAHYAPERQAFQASGISFDDFLRSGAFAPSSKRNVHGAEYKADAFISDVRTYWRDHADELDAALGKHTLMSALVWGDMDVPSIAKKFSIYFDTIFAADSTSFFLSPREHNLSPALYTPQILAYILNALEVKPLVLAESDVPLVVFYPQRFSVRGLHEATWTQERIKRVKERSDSIAGAYLSETLGVVSAGDAISDLFRQVLKLGAARISQSMHAQDLAAVFVQFSKDLSLFPSLRGKGYERLRDRVLARRLTEADLERIFVLCESLFFLLESREENSQHIGADNALSPLMWEAASRKNAFLARRFAAQVDLDADAVVAASFQRGFTWLDNVDVEDILQMREDKGIQVMRDTLRIERDLVRRASIEDFGRVSKEFEQTVIRRLEEFSDLLRATAEALRSRRRSSLLSFGASATLGAASLAFPALLPLSIGSAIYGLVVGGPSLKDLLNEHLTGKRTIADLRDRPVTLLLEAYRRSR